MLQRIEDKLPTIYVSGIRADDMALRLAYAGFPKEKIVMIKSYDGLLDAFTSQNNPVFIMPTYTAMMDLRAIVSQKYGYKEFWE